MQTLRKRTSPFKYKNDASKFMGEGITFKAKLIGILEVSEARGDKMCQDALNDLKTAIRAAGEHKQRITIGISIDGLRLRDEKTGESLYHHPVHKISFIAQDMSDSRAFGYIFGSPDIGHRFFGIKTDKTASQVVIAMRDLFQVVFELKKKEIELAKHQSDHHHVKYGSTGILDSIHFTKEDTESDKGKGKILVKSRGCTAKIGEPDSKGAAASEAIADLLDLEHELNSIQQGINQMDKITPPDPFGPLTKNDPYADPFDDSFSTKVDKSVVASTSEDKSTSMVESSLKKLPEDSSDLEKQSSFYGPTTSAAKTNFFSQLSSGIGKPKLEESWFHQDTESLFNETTNVGNAEPTSSPIALTTPASEPDQTEGKRSPAKLDLFTELDPLGTGRVKPYVDKKDFFQDLKNPPKKVLKELITENVSTEPGPSFTFSTTFKEEVPGPVIESKEETRSSVMTKTDFFVGSDPFEKTDPFQEENFSTGFSPMFGTKTSVEGLFEDKSWGFEKPSSRELKDERPGKSSPSNLLFTSPLRVSLPPEKSEGCGTVSGPFSKSPLSTPEELKNMRRRYYQVSKQWTLDGGEDSPVQEEPFVSTKITNFHGRAETERRSPFKDKFYSIQSPPTSARGEKFSSRMHSSLDRTSPDPSLRVKTSALFTIKPPPLPGKKQNQSSHRTATRTQSKEDNSYPYDYLESKETVCNGFHPKEELKCVKLKKQLFTGKDSPPTTELRKQNSEVKDSNFPVLPPPPNRKSSTDGGKMTSGRKSNSGTRDGSILNLKLNQLDNTGLENLAITLGIPSENIYSMTLQELTKMLADKYLKEEEKKMENPQSDNFEVDFEANFAKMEVANQHPQPSYDKYAVFKELIENENKGSEEVKEDEKEEREDGRSGDVKTFTQTKEEEDKYAALRQLSLNTEIPSQEMEEEEEVKPESTFGVEQLKEESTSPGPIQLGAGTLDMDDKSQSLENIEEKDEEGSLAQKMEVEKTPDQETRKETHFDSEQNLFPLVDEFSDDKKPISPRDNWATFEKSDFGDAIEEEKKTEGGGDENENSPFSSDGREEVREIPFRWHQDSYHRRKRGDVPWRDDDESWDDYSPKESYCSDESSHEEQSPEGRRSERYSNSSWREFCGKGSKTERWNRRDKWQEETEDEFEENWRKHRERLGSYDSERRAFRHSNNYENFNKRYDRCNSRGTEPWNEEERLVHSYGPRRKRSESDTDYRKRCDSDASDKECVWSVQKSYHDGHGRSGKQKSHHGPGHSFRSCPEYCHESRSKHRKGTGQKRPSSASETNRNYEKMFSPSDYGYKTAEKSYPGKRESEKEDYQRYEHSWKESRHRVDAEYPHSYSSYDRKAHHSKGSSRGSRGSNSGQSDTYPSPKQREGPEVGYFEPFEKSYKYNKPETGRHFQFEAEADNFEKPKKSSSDHSRQDFSPKRRGNQWASTNGKTEGEVFFPGRPAEENFADFRDDFKTSPKRPKGEGTSRGSFPPAESFVPQTKSRAHSAAMLSGQEPPPMALRKSDSINIFSRDKDPFEDDDFFESAS